MNTRNPRIAFNSTSEDILFAVLILCTASTLLLSLGSFPL